MSQLEKLCGAALEVKMRDLAGFAEFASAIAHEFKKGGQLAGFYFSDGGTIPDELFARIEPLLLAMAVFCTDSTAEIGDSKAFCEAVLLANRAFFTHKTDGDGSGDWYGSFQHLIGAGHRHADILDYPFSVFTGYCRAVAEQQRREDKRMAAAVRAGRFLSDRKFKEYLEAV